MPKSIMSKLWSIIHSSLVGNGWAQAQPIMSSAQPIFISIVQPVYAPFHVKYIIIRLYNTQITHFKFIVVVYAAYF